MKRLNMDNTQRRMEALYQEVGPDLLAYFQRRHGLSGLAEDLLQDTFAAAINHLDRFLASTSPRAYLFGIARNLSNDAFRERHSTELLSDDLLAKVAPADDLEPRLEPMREAIAALPELYREVLELRLQHDLSYEEVAAVLQIPIGTVRSRLHHAVSQLREAMTGPNSNLI